LLLGRWSAALLFVLDAFESDDPYQELGVSLLMLVVLTAVGGFVGAVLVVWVTLHVIHAPRAGVSALVCGLLLAVLAPVTAGVGAMLIPFDIGNGLPSALLVGTIASLVCALVTYTLITSRAKARISSQTA